MRYITAAALIVYARVPKLDLLDKSGRRLKPKMELIDWERLMRAEREWHGEHRMSTQNWEELQGWPREAGDEEHALTKALAENFRTSETPPERNSLCPPLLKPHEVDELRQYPDQMMTLVLITWCVHTLKELEVSGELKGCAGP